MKTTVALSATLTSGLAASKAHAAQDTQGTPLPQEIVVTGARLPIAATGQSVVPVDLGERIVVRLDTLLGSVPGVSLFRRANSFTAHPTTQGLSMRGVGANAAGRVLVTIDGVPQNDPFGGWIYWSAYQAQALASVSVRKGGSPGAFGAQALAGAVDIETASANQASLFFGSDNSFSVNGTAEVRGERSVFAIDAGHFATNGDFLLDAQDRGSIDVRAASNAQSVGAAYAYQLDSATTLTARLRYFGEERINGLSTATNQTDAIETSLRLQHRPDGGPAYELTAYFRTREFDNIFASARDNRTTERPVLDQFDVPGWGAGFLARVQTGAFEFGLDGRRMSGETNERFRNLGAGFTRQRRAGGDQWIIGAYGDFAAEGSWGRLSATARLDRWRTYGGERFEFSLEDGSTVRDDVVPNRSDWIGSGRIGYEADLTDAVTFRSAAFKSWRLPTLNEFYRPFRVVNDITEANPNLRPERLYGIEAGLDYTPLNSVSGSVTVFRNWLNDGVGNITVGFGPGFFPLGGFVPGGGVLRQRANVDRTKIDGVEFEGRLDLDEGMRLTAQYLYARARITQFDASPELVGNRPIQTPRHSATVSVRKNTPAGWWRLEARYASSQFDDDLNIRRLDGIFTVNAGASVRLNDTFNLNAAVENLFDAEVVSALSATGLRTIAQRRFMRIGVAANF